MGPVVSGFFSLSMFSRIIHVVVCITLFLRRNSPPHRSTTKKQNHWVTCRSQIRGTLGGYKFREKLVLQDSVQKLESQQNLYIADWRQDSVFCRGRLLLRPSMDSMRPTHIMEGNVFFNI